VVSSRLGGGGADSRLGGALRGGRLGGDRLGGAEGGRDYVLVARAAADVARQGVPYLVLGWVWVVGDQLADGHDHAGGAVAALEGVFVLEGLLNWVERAFAWYGQALDCGYLVTVGLGRQDRAGLHRYPVQGHRAGAALGGVAADVGAGEAQVVAEEVDEKGAGRDGGGAPGTVDRQLDGDLTRGGQLGPSLLGLYLGIQACESVVAAGAGVGGVDDTRGCERLHPGVEAVRVSFPIGKLHNGGMRLSARADYALRAAIELAAAHDGHVTAEQLAQAQNIPGKFLETILTHLRRSNIVRSQRGPDGGFWLARPASEISLADIIRAIDGQLLGVRGERPENVTYPGAAEPLQRVWIALRANERAVLEAVTLADIVSGELPPAVAVLTDSPQAWL
jgi:Rrf2 family protein